MSDNDRRNEEFHYKYCPKESTISKLEERMDKIERALYDNGHTGLLSNYNNLDKKIGRMLEFLPKILELDENVRQLIIYRSETEAAKKATDIARKEVDAETEKRIKKREIELKEQTLKLQFEEARIRKEERMKLHKRWIVGTIIAIITALLGFLI